MTNQTINKPIKFGEEYRKYVQENIEEMLQPYKLSHRSTDFIVSI